MSGGYNPMDYCPGDNCAWCDGPLPEQPEPDTVQFEGFCSEECRKAFEVKLEEFEGRRHEN